MALPALVFLALVAFAAALAWSPHAARPAFLHLVLAVGAMPLIFGAMGHFIPVLTRTRRAPPALAAVPLLALAGGALAVTSMHVPAFVWARHAGALTAVIGAIALLAWSRRRRAGMLGRPHPGLAWYEAALACLILALIAILVSAAWPQQTLSLRRLHLHLNTLGFIGLTALGTLAVLLPTAVGRPDPGAGPRLSRSLPWVLGGTILVAAGAAWFAPLAWAGAIVWAVPLAWLAADWSRLYRAEIFAVHGPAPLLAAAPVGFAVSLLSGAGAPLFPVFAPEAAFVSGFLLPLVTGASTQLLPVWLRPGVQGAWHARLRSRLGRHGGTRAVLFGVAGVASGAGLGWGLLLGAAALLWFILQAVAALARGLVIEKELSP
ncbi:MAG TPA: hypothetical protein PKC12_05695 [Thiobacillaceae bacterium]|nr:hypothetical protein [Thiobacillaceae bacterium]